MHAHVVVEAWLDDPERAHREVVIVPEMFSRASAPHLISACPLAIQQTNYVEVIMRRSKIDE